MTFKIALAGNGGSGKSSLASLIIRYLLNNRNGAVLAVDADANANLGDGLGLEIEQTIGGVLAQFNDEKMTIPAGLSKDAWWVSYSGCSVAQSTSFTPRVSQVRILLGVP